MFTQAWARCRSNLKANLMAGVCIWITGAIICFSYYKVGYFTDWLDQLGRLKKEHGFLYSALATSFFGGVIPFACLLLQRNIPEGKKVSWLIFFIFFWAIKGIEVDAFYRLQVFIFGESKSIGVIFYKVLNDLFVYCVFWSAPVTAIFYGWKQADFAWSDVQEIRNPRKLVSESIFLLISTWIIWIPALAVVYAMPSNLQIPCFNLNLCFFVLVISYLNSKREMAG